MIFAYQINYKMKKSDKIIFWIATGLLSALMLMSASMYLFTHEQASTIFAALGFPVYIIYPLAILKILGVLAITTNKFGFLKEWAYAGFFFNFVLAASAHINAGDGEFMVAVIALVLLLTSYIFNRRMNTSAS